MHNMDLFWNSIYGIITVLYMLYIISTALVVVLENRSPVRTVAWVLVLLFIPVAGLIIYIFFGQKFGKERTIARRSIHSDDCSPACSLAIPDDKRMPTYRGIMSLVHNADQSVPLYGNCTDIFTEGGSFIDSLISDIRHAKHFIHMEFYIIDDDNIGRTVRDALAQKAGEGVEVRFIYDDVGCLKTKDKFFRPITSNGGQVFPFLEVRFPRFSRKVNFRNHRKLVIIDGKTAYIGGMNIADRYASSHWRDLHIRLTGDIVFSIPEVFLRDWHFVSREFLSDPRLYPQNVGATERGRAQMQIALSSPAERWRGIRQGLLKIILEAKKYIYIITPYFLPDEVILSAMQTAALSGVSVKLMIPEKGDNRIVNLGTRSYIYDILRCGAEVIMYKPAFIHSKLVVCDDSFVSIGSSNMDFRSFDNNFEANCFIYDEHLAKTCRDIFIGGIRQGRIINPEAWKRRPKAIRLTESVVRMFSPLF